MILSSVNISQIEVWVTNIGAATEENRNIVAFADLGEPEPYNERIEHVVPRPIYPTNRANGLLTQLDVANLRNVNNVSNYLRSTSLNMTAGQDFEKVESARKLTNSEFSFNSALGFISLNTTLNANQVLAVAFQYTIIGDTTVYQVGELSTDGIPSTQCLVVKLLRSTSVNTQIPLWDLMMKNVYALGAYQLSREDFTLNILYSGSSDGVPIGYFKEPEELSGTPLIEIFGFDHLDAHENRYPDGIFDFIDNASTRGGTIQSTNGRIYFTVREPFGSYLRNKLNDNALANKYCYDSLYTMTKTQAQQYPEKNKFSIEGSYKASGGGEISLNALNVPEGSVVVTAGGRTLVENVDYTIDYTLGRVKIINDGILSSGTPINVSFEDNSGFAILKRTFLGFHVDHQISKNFVVGGTFLNLYERPLTQKTNLGDDPINNVIWGLNADYQTESNMITKMVDALPVITTTAPSRVNITGEFAHFIPGHSKAIGKSGTSYIDDFEAATTTIDLKTTPIRDWYLASTPQHNTRFPEGNLGITLETGYNRAQFSWYIIDPIFYESNTNTVPANVTRDELSKNSVRQVLQTEVFPNKDLANGTNTNISVLNMAYYPGERGPYNYDVNGSNYSAGIDENGRLLQPETRWGGVMRAIDASDFDRTNVEYIELWMMDPFTENPEHKGGDILFHLGDISEDILRDSRKSFENGLPINEEVVNVEETIWGRVPTTQNLVSSFSTENASRPFQDVGYDGLRDVDERTFPFIVNKNENKDYLSAIADAFGGGSNAWVNAYNDPSGDNYHYFRGDGYDEGDQYASILDKYKRYNGPDGNSPVDNYTAEGYNTQSTTLPNAEDIDNDNTLSEDERYYEYRISLRPEDMMMTGENHIVDIYHAQNVRLANGAVGDVNWYQFQIPVRNPERIIGNISDFTSIRFMRVVFDNFEEEVVCRFAKFQLVRADWRRYEYDLLAPGEYIPNDDQSTTIFKISTVNIEENAYRYPVPYVLPPGIERETSYSTSMNYTQQNEQAMSIKVVDLIDGDARAVYKTTDFDFTQYKHLKMYVHAEDADVNNPNETGEMTVFIRMGSDLITNYYEYEIPLVFTPWGTSRSNPDAIWPEANRIDINLESLVEFKLERNVAIREDGSSYSFEDPYIVYDGINKITIVGSPTISDIRSMMIGVRNPKSVSALDDNRARSAEIWVNELRLTDFINQQGWAATGQMRIDLADFGNVQFAMLHSSAGFGSLEQKTNDRSKDNITTVDVGTNMELGRFAPEKWGVRLPLHFDYSYNEEKPKYDPLNPDIKLKDMLATFEDNETKSEYKDMVLSKVQRTNVNFMNVRKDRLDVTKKPHFWDVENLDLSYAFSQTKKSDVDVEFDDQLKHTGGIGYTFTGKPKQVRPFAKMKAFKGKWLQLIRDFNFYYLPNSFTFRTNLEREYQEKKLRNKSNADIIIIPSYYKNFVWDRTYNLRWDITQGLKLEYQSVANTFMNELPGGVGTDKWGTKQEKKQTLTKQFFNGGTYKGYNQRLLLNYTVPLNKLPLTDWITLTGQYQGNYTWTANSLALRDTYGNTIENSATISINGSIKFTTLYNKIPYLKKLNSSRSRVTKPTPKKAASDTTTIAKKKEGPSFGKKFGDGVLKFLMMVKDVSGRYQRVEGTMLPGFMKDPGLFGVNGGAPGWDFVFGWQEDDFVERAIMHEWLTTDTNFNTAFAKKLNETFNAKATIEPFRDFRIELTMNRQYTENHAAYMVANSDGTFSDPTNPTINGSFNMTTLMIGTSFSKVNVRTAFSEVYDRMKEYRQTIAFIVANENQNWVINPEDIDNPKPVTDSTGFPSGYGPTSQDVLLYSFLAAYQGKDVNKMDVNKVFPSMPLPNWRISWKGLTKIEPFKKWFKNFTVNHNYTSTYSISGFQNNLNYREDAINNDPLAKNEFNNYISKFNLGQVSLIEQFTPLIGFDMTLHNSITLRLEYKRTRNYSMSFVNNQLTEQRAVEWSVGAGYIINKMPVLFKTRHPETSLKLSLDVGIRDNATTLRRLDSGIDEISQGNWALTINFAADYKLSRTVTARLYFDRNQTNPYVALQYRTTNTEAGVSVIFSLAQ
ncbi:MAG: cell surface protein SprA [Bacteroidales bacterium]|nr:cell surface protein SprA [Bacteroidales bacterium]